MGSVLIKNGTLNTEMGPVPFQSHFQHSLGLWQGRGARRVVRAAPIGDRWDGKSLAGYAPGGDPGGMRASLSEIDVGGPCFGGQGTRGWRLETPEAILCHG